MGKFFRLLWWIDCHINKGLVPMEYKSVGCYYLGNIVLLLTGGILLMIPLLIHDLFEPPYARKWWKEQLEQRKEQLKEIEMSGKDRIIYFSL